MSGPVKPFGEGRAANVTVDTVEGKPLGKNEKLACECFEEGSNKARELGRNCSGKLNDISGKGVCVCKILGKSARRIIGLSEDQMKKLDETVTAAVRKTFREEMHGPPKKDSMGREATIKIVRGALTGSRSEISQKDGSVEVKFEILARDHTVSPDDILAARDVFIDKFETHLKPEIVKLMKGFGIKSSSLDVSYSGGIRREVTIKITM